MRGRLAPPSRSGVVVTLLPDEQVMEAVRAAAAIVLERDPATVVRGCRLLDDLGADSLAMAGMLDLIEERLGPLAGRPVCIDDAVVHKLATVGELADLAASLVAGAR